MHILIVTSTHDRSETHTWKQFVKRGEHITVAGLPNAPERANLEAAGVTFKPIVIRHRLDYAAVRALRRIVKESQPDLIYAPRNSPLAVSLMATRACPIVGYRGTIGHLSHWDPASWLTYFHPRLAHIICVSDAVREYLLKMRVRPDRTTCIYKGHDIAWYDAPATETRASLRIPDDAFCVGFTGSVRPVKGVDVFIKALQQMPVDTYALIVGELREAHLQHLVSELGLSERVKFVGFRKDAVHLMKLLDAFVMPSLDREGLPRAVIEAMAQERPVVVSNVGGLPELVLEGDSGFIVPPADPNALAERLCWIRGNRPESMAMGARARQRILTDFNIESTVDQMLTLFRKIAHQS